MKVRIWITGPDGPSRDFELLTAPRSGEHISITVGGKVEEGIVASVAWHLQAIETGPDHLALEGDPLGSVTLVHVVCRPGTGAAIEALEAAEIAQTATAERPQEHQV